MFLSQTVNQIWYRHLLCSCRSLFYGYFLEDRFLGWNNFGRSPKDTFSRVLHSLIRQMLFHKYYPWRLFREGLKRPWWRSFDLSDLTSTNELIFACPLLFIRGLSRSFISLTANSGKRRRSVFRHQIKSIPPLMVFFLQKDRFYLPTLILKHP